MKAAVVGEHGVEVRDLPKPEPKPNEVLIRVRASSLNRADLLVSRATSTARSAASARGSGSNAPARSKRSAARCRASRRATASWARRPAAMPNTR